MNRFTRLVERLLCILMGHASEGFIEKEAQLNITGVIVYEVLCPYCNKRLGYRGQSVRDIDFYDAF